MIEEDKIKNGFSSENFDDIDLKYLFNFLLRNKFKIILATFGITILSILLTFTQKNIFQGNFRILVEKEKERGSAIQSVLMQLPINPKGQFSDSKTLEHILKSSYVLSKPYNQFLKNIKNKNYELIRFETWANQNLAINFLEKSKVVEVKFKYADKDLIISTLNDISDKFKQYSIEEKIKTIKQSREFLETQLLILDKKSRDSLNNLNVFAIKNGLGDIDGFVKLNKKSTIIDDSNQVETKINKGREITNKVDSAQRFKTQFALLERYESIYLTLSAELEPSSKELTNLEQKIKYLKASLKRPSEILVEFRNLKRIAERDLTILEEVDSQLNLTKFEEAKEAIPWLVIQEPKISGQIAPRRSLTAFVSLIFSFIGISTFLYLQEKNSGNLFEIEDINKNLKFNYIDELYYENFDLNELILKNTINDFDKNINISDLGVIFCSIEFNKKNISHINNYFKIKLNNITLSPNKQDGLKKPKVILLFIESGEISINEITILNNYLNLYKEKVIGWISLNNRNFTT